MPTYTFKSYFPAEQIMHSTGLENIASGEADACTYHLVSFPADILSDVENEAKKMGWRYVDEGDARPRESVPTLALAEGGALGTPTLAEMNETRDRLNDLIQCLRDGKLPVA